jgi:hypothetical protein
MMLEQDADFSTELSGQASSSKRERFQRQPLARVVLAIAASLLIVVLAVLGLVLATNHSAGKNPMPTSPERLTSSRASSIEGVPVPKQAHLDQSDQHSAEYTVPASANDVKAWYLAHLQIGKPWRSWSWVGATTPCAGRLRGDALLWQWASGRSTLMLVVYNSQADRPFGAVTIDVYRQTPFCTTAS